MTSPAPPPKVLNPSTMPAIERAGGASTVRLVSRALGSRAMINGITSIPPGGGIPRHFHNCEESVLVLEGTGVVELGETKQVVAPGDLVWVPANVPHRFRNDHTAAMLRIFFTYADANATRTIVETGETKPIDAEHEAST